MANHLWVKPRPYEKAKEKLCPGKSYFTKSKQITIIVLIKKDWLIYSSFYYYCLSCFLWYWFFAMLAVLTYLSIEPKKETLHFFLFFLQICTFSYFYLTHRWFILVKLFLTFALTKILNTQSSQLAASGKFSFKNANFLSIILLQSITLALKNYQIWKLSFPFSF